VNTHPSIKTRSGGFTLLEVVMAILLMTILIGMVFSTSRASLMLGANVVKTQNEEMLHQAFFELLGNRFSAMPGNTRFDLKFEDGGQITSDLTMQNVPMGFTWGGEEKIAKAVQISTVRRRDGFLDIVLRYYENEVLEDSNGQALTTSQLDTEPFAEVVLLEDVEYFEWRVLDGRTMEWQYDWDIQGRLPLQLELKVKFGAEGQEIRQVFWITPKQNPEVMMRQLQQGQGNQNTGGGNGGININPGGGVVIPGGGGGGQGGNGQGGGNGGRR